MELAENQALGRRMKNAKLRVNACVEDIDYRTARGLDKSMIRALTQESAWVGTHENIFVLGPTGVGKSFVACALAQKACRDGYSALYTRAQTLFRDLAMARADGSLRSLLARLSRIDVLVIDDWVMAPLGTRAPRLLGDLRGPLSGALDDPDLATAGHTLARTDRRSHLWPTASLTGLSTTRTASRCEAIRCARIGGSRMPDLRARGKTFRRPTEIVLFQSVICERHPPRSVPHR